MRGSPFYPQVPEVRMGQLHLRAEDNPDSEKCPIRAQIFIALCLLLQSKGLLSLATGSRKEALPLSGPDNKPRELLGKFISMSNLLPSGPGLSLPCYLGSKKGTTENMTSIMWLIICQNLHQYLSTLSKCCAIA